MSDATLTMTVPLTTSLTTYLLHTTTLSLSPIQHFYDRREAHSFAIIVHAYYQLLVNANEVILTGNLAPQEQFLRVGCNRKYRPKWLDRVFEIM